MLAVLGASTFVPSAFAQSAKPATPELVYPIMHLHTSFASSSCPSPRDAWGILDDVYGSPEVDAPSTGTVLCDAAEWDSGGDGFTPYLWVPGSYADATVCLGFYNSSAVRVGIGCVDESHYTDQWARVQRSWGTIRSSITSIRWSSNNGETGTYTGLGCPAGLALSYGGTPAPLPKTWGLC